jgi:hypothetical protein
MIANVATSQNWKKTGTSTFKIQAYMQPYFAEHHCFLVLKKKIGTCGSLTLKSFERKFQQLCDSENI